MAAGECGGGPRHPRFEVCLGHVLRTALVAALAQPSLPSQAAGIFNRTLHAVDSAARGIVGASETVPSGISDVGEAVAFLLQHLRAVELLGEVPTMPRDTYVPNERSADFSYGATFAP